MSIRDPDGTRHWAVRLAPSPDPRRPGWQDPRVVEARCGKVVALVGEPRRSAPRTSCVWCFA